LAEASPQRNVDRTHRPGRPNPNRGDGGAGAISPAVEDDGEGIEAGDIPFLFDRFFRGHRGGRDTTKHLGLGLAIVKELIEAHGGRVGADARERGARIWFTLPKRNG
jgi:two-component system, OmpR family, sensor histidine kinase BaeS